MTERRDQIQDILNREFKPVHLEVVDDSGRHIGHAGSGGGGHFLVTLVSANFEEVSLMDQHRMVHQALDKLFDSDIHALGLKTYSPSQWKSF